MTQQVVEDFNYLLKNELAAVEAYKQVLSKINKNGDNKILQDAFNSHKQRAEKLQNAIIQAGGQPISELGVGGKIAKLVIDGAGAISDETMIGALAEDEGNWTSGYEWLLVSMHGDHRNLVKEDLLPKQQQTEEKLRELENSELVAFVSDDKTKIRELSKKYKVKYAWSYDEYDECLNSGEIDAVYIALPNHMHEEFTIKAANAGIHVLCEKPLAPTGEACQRMVQAARKNDVKLMTAYRLHFDEANMFAVDTVNSGKIGEPKSFNSVFTLQVRKGNIRTKKSMAGGPLYDIGIYCINAARYLFKGEPTEVIAMATKGSGDRFAQN